MDYTEWFYIGMLIILLTKYIRNASTYLHCFLHFVSKLSRRFFRLSARSSAY